ncbi:MAG TPA: hypothetical protein VFO67_00210 [Gemmatimonadales bacterium]|nr:hypothetical protein [Gemmatimonadales bacterium]
MSPASRHLPYFSLAAVQAAQERLSSLPFCSAADYVSLNKGVAKRDIDPLFHMLAIGAYEGRQLFTRENVARVLCLDGRDDVQGSSSQDRAGTALLTERSSPFPPATVYVSSLGNVFMNEIAHDLAHDLSCSGIRVSIENETSALPSRAALSIVVAPHEFFWLGRGTTWMRDDVLPNMFVYNTEQLHTPWFAKALLPILAAKGVLDMSPQVARLLREAGMRSMHFEPSSSLRTRWLEEADADHPLFRALPRDARRIEIDVDEWDNRPIDVSFFGTESSSRESFFAGNAERLAKWSSFIYYRRHSRGPIKNSLNDRALTRIAGHVAGYSKISLNIHRDEFPFFEWHRIVRQCMASGSVVVSDPCLPHPQLKPGEHYFEEEPRQIPNLIDWLLRDTEGQREARRVRDNASEHLKRNGDRRLQVSELLKRLSE